MSNDLHLHTPTDDLVEIEVDRYVPVWHKDDELVELD